MSHILIVQNHFILILYNSAAKTSSKHCQIILTIKLNSKIKSKKSKNKPQSLVLHNHSIDTKRPPTTIKVKILIRKWYDIYTTTNKKWSTLKIIWRCWGPSRISSLFFTLVWDLSTSVCVKFPKVWRREVLPSWGSRRTTILRPLFLTKKAMSRKMSTMLLFPLVHQCFW